MWLSWVPSKALVRPQSSDGEASPSAAAERDLSCSSVEQLTMTTNDQYRRRLPARRRVGFPDGASPLFRFAALHQPRGVARHLIDLDIDPIAGLPPAPGR